VKVWSGWSGRSEGAFPIPRYVAMCLLVGIGDVLCRGPEVCTGASVQCVVGLCLFKVKIPADWETAVLFEAGIDMKLICALMG